MGSGTTILPVRPVEKRVAVVPDVGFHSHVQAHYVEASLETMMPFWKCAP